MVDSLLKENITDSIALALSAMQGAFISNNEMTLDVQTLKKERKVTSIYVVVLLLLVLIVFLKYLYTNFFQSGLLSLANEKIFFLHFRGKKFSQVPAMLILVTMKLSIAAIVLQYGIFHYTGHKELETIHIFLQIFAFLTIFSFLRFFGELIVQFLAGQSKIFYPYIVQHLLITTWLWLPSVVMVLVVEVNEMHLTLPLFLTLVLTPIALSTVYSLLRAAFIWSPVLKQNLLYFFVYFCSFKILPYLIAARWLSENWRILT